MAHQPEPTDYDGPAGGWGSLRGIFDIMAQEMSSPGALETLRRQNKTGGVMCVSCAWAKPANYSAFEFCENGAKATLWEMTSGAALRCSGRNRPYRHRAADWTDHDLEMTGRLTHPLRYDAVSDRYVEVTWDEAFAGIAAALQPLEPDQAVFYASGHAGLEASYLYASAGATPMARTTCRKARTCATKRPRSG